MITISIIFILLYSYSVYKIKKDSGSWEYFNPYDCNFLIYIIFAFGTGIIGLGIIAIVLYLIKYNIIP
jgi:hypothetical protein